MRHKGASDTVQKRGNPEEVSQETLTTPGEGGQSVVSSSLMALTLRHSPQRCPGIPDRLGDTLQLHP